MSVRPIVKSILTLILIVVGYSTAHAFPQGVDLNDVIRFSGDSADVNLAHKIIEGVSTNKNLLKIPDVLIYKTAGLTSLNESAIYSLHVQNLVNTNDILNFDLFAIFSDGSKKMQMTKAQVQLDIVNGIFQIGKMKNVDLNSIQFSAQIDIFNRQVFLTNKKYDFKKVYPVAVGALVNEIIGDPTSRYQTLSPNYPKAYLSKSHSEMSRVTPDYYAGRPFLRIIDRNQSEHSGFTPFGVHYQMTSHLRRGFISNGCFRMRDNDLYEIGTILFSARGSGIALTTVTAHLVQNQHPYPLNNSSFNTPKVMMGADGKYTFVKDEHDLFDFSEVSQDPMQVLK